MCYSSHMASAASRRKLRVPLGAFYAVLNAKREQAMRQRREAEKQMREAQRAVSASRHSDDENARACAQVKHRSAVQSNFKALRDAGRRLLQSRPYPDSVRHHPTDLRALPRNASDETRASLSFSSPKWRHVDVSPARKFAERRAFDRWRKLKYVIETKRGYASIGWEANCDNPSNAKWVRNVQLPEMILEVQDLVPSYLLAVAVDGDHQHEHPPRHIEFTLPIVSPRPGPRSSADCFAA